MRKKRLLVEVIFILLLLTVLSGCQWFSDNPMFPRAKFMVTGEPTHLTPKEGERVVTVKFRPINKVGAMFSKCTIVYRKPDGTVIPSLTRSVALNFTIYDPNWTAAGALVAGTEPASVTIEVLDMKTEGYLKSNKIPLVIAELTFSGEDLAGHPLELSTEVFVQAFEGLIKQDDITIYVHCSSPESGGNCVACAACGGEAYMAVDLIEAQLVSRVEYFINGKSAGSSTAPPFVSQRVSVASCEGIAQAVVYDIFGNYTVVTKEFEKKEEEKEENNETATL